MLAAKAVTRPWTEAAALPVGRRPGPGCVPTGWWLGERDDPDGPFRAGGVVRRRPDPRGIGVQAMDELSVVREHMFPPLSSARCPSPARATTRASMAVRSTTRCSAAAAAATRTPSTRWQTIDRASSAAVTAAATPGRSLTTAHDVTGATPVSTRVSTPAGSSKIGPKRGLAPPSVACATSAFTKARGIADCRTPSRDATLSARTTSSKRGRSTTATSDPPAKSTWPEHQPKSSLTRWAPNGPRFSGPGIEPSESPPPPPALPALRARSSAVATIRVLAMGDIVLTVTPAGSGERAAR